MLLLLHFLLHLGLLLPQLLLLLDLLDDAHLVGIIIAQFFEIRVHLRLSSVNLRSFKVGFQFLTLLFDLLLDHLHRAISKFLLLTMPIANQGLFFLLKPALVVEEPIEIVQVLSVYSGVHAEF